MYTRPDRTGLLLVHGIQGHPRQFQFLISRFPEGTLYRNLLLPGHGKDVNAFRHSGKEQWLDAVRQAAEELRVQCGRLVFVGHSMGCLLGLDVEREHPGIFAEMLLICCPFYIRPTFRYLRNSIASIRPAGEKESPVVQAAREANGVAAAHAAQYLTCVHPYMELFRLMRGIRKDCPVPEGEARFFFSGQDEIVSRRSVRFAEEHFGKPAEVLEDCGHYLFSGDARKKIINAVKRT